MIYLHLGLHKTATTSLQSSVFPEIEGVYFLGRGNGGVAGSDELYQELCNYCFSSKLDRELELQLKNKVALREKKEGNLLISDEWFTADYSGFFGYEGGNWQFKLEKLANIMAGLNVKVLMTIRKPVEAIYSQYSEFQKVGVNLKYETLIKYSDLSNDSKAFDYEKLDLFLKHFFNLDVINYLTFDEIRDGSYHGNLKRFFMVASIPDIKEKNSKVKGKNGEVLVVENNKILADLKRLTPKKVKSVLLFFKPIKKFDKIITSLTSKKIKVDRLAKEDVQYLSVLFSDATKFYKRMYFKNTGENK